MNKRILYSPEGQERAVRLVLGEHKHPSRWVARQSVTAKIGCTPETLRTWINKSGPWKGVEDVEYATLNWVDWFNRRRILEPIGDG